MAEDYNLQQRLAVCMMTPNLEQCEKVMKNLRFIHSSVIGDWRYFQPERGGDYRWGWFDGILLSLATVTPNPPLMGLPQAPYWVDESLHPRGDEFPWVPNIPVEAVPDWEAFVRAVCERYAYKKDGTQLQVIKFFKLDNETNVDGLWKGTPQEYAERVIIPAAKIIHEYGAKVVAPGITIQKFESQAHYDRSRAHMKAILAIAGDDIDIISFHSYGNSAERVIDQNYSFVKDCELRGTIWCTETGFPEDLYWLKEDIPQSLRMALMTGQSRQEERFKTWTPVVESRPGIQRQFIYRGWDVGKLEADKHGTNGLLTPRLRQKKAAEYLKAQLMEDKPKP